LRLGFTDSVPTRKYTTLAIALVAVVLILGSAAYLTLSPMGKSTTTLTNFATSTVSNTITSYNSSSGELGPWTVTTGYPFAATSLSCVSSGGYAYCVGGYNGTTPTTGVGVLNATYYAALSATGVGPWMRTTDYPIGIQDQSCVSSSSYIYCIAGLTAAPNGTESVYYALLSPSGIGPWSRTTTFPYSGETSCMASSGYAYCVKAQFSNETTYLGYSAVYFAPLSSSGAGNWTESDQVPKNPAGCSANDGYGYCFGGGDCPPPGPCPSTSYYALLSPNGSSVWNLTSNLPGSGYGAYATADSYEYYFANELYFAHLSPGGIGEWATTTPYPVSGPASCVANGLYLYCIGDFANDVYFARVNP
jgi:hypothetical protein